MENFKTYMLFQKEDQSPSLPQELAHCEEKLEKTLALINTVYHITDVRHSLFPIEYPDTSDNGIVYVFHIENWTDRKAVFSNVKKFIFQLSFLLIIN